MRLKAFCNFIENQLQFFKKSKEQIYFHFSSRSQHALSLNNLSSSSIFSMDKSEPVPAQVLSDDIFFQNVYSLFDTCPLITELKALSVIRERRPDQFDLKEIPKVDFLGLMFKVAKLSLQMCRFFDLLHCHPNALRNFSDPFIYKCVAYPLEKICLHFE